VSFLVQPIRKLRKLMMKVTNLQSNAGRYVEDIPKDIKENVSAKVDRQ
jgi:hypothetical protein